MSSQERGLHVREKGDWEREQGSEPSTEGETMGGGTDVIIMIEKMTEL